MPVDQTSLDFIPGIGDRIELKKSPGMKSFGIITGVGDSLTILKALRSIKVDPVMGIELEPYGSGDEEPWILTKLIVKNHISYESAKEQR